MKTTSSPEVSNCHICQAPFTVTLATICLRQPSSGAFVGFTCSDECADIYDAKGSK